MSLPIVEQITQDLAETLADVSTANGCHFDLAVRRWSQHDNGPIKHGLCILKMGDCQPLEDGVSSGRRFWLQDYHVIVFIVSAEGDATPVEQYMALARADVEKAVVDDVHRGGLARNTTLQGVLVDDGHDGSQPYTTVQVMVQVQYDTLRDDPYSR